MKTAPRPSLPRSLLAALVLGVTCAGLSGCVVLAVGAAAAGAVAYVKGELRATLAEPVGDVITATDAAITDLKFFRLSDQRDALTANFVARNARDDRITISVKQAGDNLTQVAIRVGLLGDETLSRTILDTIKQHL